MSSNVNAIIKLRTDTIENWTIYNPIIHENEQIVVKLSDGKVGYKLGTGARFNSTPFVSYESISTDTINHGNAVLSLPTESGTLATLLPLYSNLQVIKPECTFHSHIHAVVSDSQDFSKVLFELDSNVSPNLFKALSNGKWFNIESSGFGIEYNNCPVLINFKENLKSYTLTSSTILYINYYWYYTNEDELIKSDIYSSVLPSNTEVGANSQDVISKSELNNALESKADIDYVNDKLSSINISGNTLIADENDEVYKVIRFTESSPVKWISSDLDSSYLFDVLSYGNGRFVGTNSMGNKGIYYSFDGIKWIKSISSEVSFKKIIYSDKFVAIGSHVWISSDGVNWTKLDGISGSLTSITYDGSKYILLKKDLDSNIENYGIYESTDLINWTHISELNLSINDISYCNDKYLIGTLNTGIWYSTNCVNWIKSDQKYGCIYSFSYGNNKYVATAPGNVLVSDNGINWKSTIIDNSYSKVIYCGNSFIVAGDSISGIYKYVIYQSVDCNDWIDISSDYLYDTDNFYGIVCSDNKVVVIEHHKVRYTYLNTTTDVKLPLADKEYVDSKLGSIYSTYSNIQVIKPYSNKKSHIKLNVSVDPEFSNTLFELDSKVNSDKFKGLANSDGAKWLSIDETGFGIEYNNCPILVNLLDSIKSSNLKITNETVLYISYYWYYEFEGVEVKSDSYSTVLPSGTEVGANSQDVVGKSELSSLVYGCNIPATNVEGLDEYLEEHGVSGIITNQDIDARSLTLNGDLVVGNGLNGPITAITSSPGYTVMRLKDSNNDNYYHMYLDNGQLVIATETGSQAGDLSNAVDESATSIITSVFGYSVIKWKDKSDGSYRFMIVEDGAIKLVDTLPEIANPEYGLIAELKDKVNRLEETKADRSEIPDITSQSFNDAVLSVINNNFSNAENTLY